MLRPSSRLIGRIYGLAVSEELLDEGILATEALYQSGLCASRSEARRLIQQGGAYANSQRLMSVGDYIDVRIAQDGVIVLSRGQKNHRLIIPASAAVGCKNEHWYKPFVTREIQNA